MENLFASIQSRHCPCVFSFAFGRRKGEADRANPSKIIAKNLRTPNLPNYQDTPLGKAIEDVAKKADVKITFDPKGLAEEGITEETPITLTTKHEIMLKSTLFLYFASPAFRV